MIEDYAWIPVADYWRVTAYHWSDLWVQPDIIPTLIFLLDNALFRGRMYLPIVLSAIAYLTVWFALAWAVYSQLLMKPVARNLALLLAGIVMAWRGCSMEISTPIDLRFTLTQAAVALSFVALARLSETGKSRYVGATLFAAIAATCSSSGGVLLWPLLIVSVRLFQIRKRHALILAGSAIVFATLDLIGYRHQLVAFSSPIAFLSLPFATAALGALNLIVMAGFFSFAWRRGFLKLRLGILIFGSYLFIVLSGFVIAAPSKSWHYVTFPMSAWALLAVAVIWWASEAASKDWSCLAAVLLGVFYACGFMSAKNWIRTTRLDAQNAQVTAIMLRDHVFDPAQARKIFPDPKFILGQSARLREAHKSIWARGDDKWIGQDVRTLYPDNQAISGGITSVYPIEGGLKILGWADTHSLTDQHAILFVDSSHKIVGFGKRPTAGMPADLSTWNTPDQLSFIGFVRLNEPVAKLSVYVRTLNGSQVRPLAEVINVPTFTASNGDTGLTALPDVEWRPDVNWTLKGYPPGTENGPTGAIYGSWTNSSVRTGAIHSEPFTPPNGCVVLPLLHGSSSYGQAVELRDASTDQAIVKLPLLDGRSAWQFWRCPIPTGTAKVFVWADDEGNAPSQWTAIATPEPCQ